MLRLKDRYTSHVLFKTVEEKSVVPRALFWGAAVSAFLVANAPPKKLAVLLAAVFQHKPARAIVGLLPRYNSSVEDILLTEVLIPLKGFVFLLAFLIMVYPLIRALRESKAFWYELGIRKIAVRSFWIFLILSLLAAPYSYPYGLHPDVSGLSGLGKSYAAMSQRPFAENKDTLYGRILKPAIAHFLHLDGKVPYYLLSLVFTYALIFLTIAFIESKSDDKKPVDGATPIGPWAKFWVLVSVMTTSYMMVTFQWPGYPEQVSFILILLMACIPMNAQARLAACALCMLTHDGSGFALVPIIWFCFPRNERYEALFIIVLFFGVVAVSYGLNLYQGVLAHGAMDLKNQQPVWSAVIENPGFTLAGWFFAYKLLWPVMFYVAWVLAVNKDIRTLLVIFSMLTLPAVMSFVAWDTTRLMGFGFLGMMIAVSVLLHESTRWHGFRYSILSIIFLANILCPAYNVVLEYQDSISGYPYPGLYLLIHRLFTHF